ncbi:MAG: hypothetical protein V1702_03645 [Candidatus Woesearchaeota archaeon]
MIKCIRCDKPIKKAENLNILAFLGINLQTACNDCCAGMLRDSWMLGYLPKMPINGEIFQLYTRLSTAVLVLIFLLLLSNLGRQGQNIDFLSIFLLFALIPVVWQWRLLLGARKIVKSIGKK